MPRVNKGSHSPNKSFLVMDETGHVEISIRTLHCSMNMQNRYAFLFKLKKFNSDTTQSLTIPFCGHFRSRITFQRMQIRSTKSLRFLRTKTRKHPEELLGLLQCPRIWKTTQIRHLINLNYSCWYKNLMCVSVHSGSPQPCKDRISCSQPLKKMFINLF